MAYPFDTNDMSIPGLETVLETVQNQFWWGPASQQTFLPVCVSGATRDAGNTVTTVVRGGMLMGRILSSGKIVQWGHGATDGSEKIVGILPAPLKMTDSDGNDKDRYTYLYVGGNAMSDRILIPASAAEGIVDAALEFCVANQLQALGIKLDRHYHYGNAFQFGARPQLLTTAEAATNNAVTVAKTDHGTTFLMTSAGTAADGNVTFTVPTAVKGLVLHFSADIATHSAILDVVDNELVVPGDVAADTLTLAPGESCTLVGIAAAKYALTNYTQVDAT